MQGRARVQKNAGQQSSTSWTHSGPSQATKCLRNQVNRIEKGLWVYDHTCPRNQLKRMEGG